MNKPVDFQKEEPLPHQRHQPKEEATVKSEQQKKQPSTEDEEWPWPPVG